MTRCDVGSGKLLFSGFKIGAMAAMRGSFVFILIAIPIFGSDILLEIREPPIIILMYFYGFIFGIVSSLLYSLLPGVVGGVLLAFWLSKQPIKYPQSLWISGGLVGGVSGLIISILIFLLLGEFFASDINQTFIDQTTFVVGTVLAILIASGAGIWAAFRLYRIIFNSEAPTNNMPSDSE